MNNIILFHQDLSKYSAEDIRLMAKHSGLQGHIDDLRWMLAIQGAGLIVKGELPPPLFPVLEAYAESGKLTLKELLNLRRVNSDYKKAINLETIPLLVSKLKNVTDEMLINYIKDLSTIDSEERRIQVKIIKGLIKNKNIDPSVNNNEAIMIASENGHVDVVRALLENDKVNPSSSDYGALEAASRKGQVDVVRVLLADDRVDPSVRRPWALHEASRKGQVDVVRVLLEDGRVDPSVENNFPLVLASKHGHEDVVKILLEDPRIDPTVGFEDALYFANKFGHWNIEKILSEYLKK